MLDLLVTASPLLSVVAPLAGGATGLLGLGWGVFRHGFGPNKWVLGGIGVAAATFLVYHLWTSNALLKKINDDAAALQEAAAARVVLETSNRQLAAASAIKDEAGRQQLEELAALRRADERIRADLAAATRRSDRMAAALVRAQRAPGSDGESEHLIGAVNRNIRCRLDNLGRSGGRCVAGQWKAGR